MKKFFDPTEYTEVIIPMYGLIHLITVLVMVLLILLALWKKDVVKRLVADKRFMSRFMIIFLAIEIFYLVLSWIYKVEPFYERFPLHLCASMALLMPILILKGNDRLILFFSYWSISCGFISFANPGFVFDEPWSFAFIHYLIRHYFLLLVPVFIQIGKGYEHKYPEFLKSLTALALWTLFIFFLDWVSRANFLYLGKNNILEVPFLPKSFTVWPWSLPSFAVVGIILLHLAYLSFLLLGRNRSTERIAD